MNQVRFGCTSLLGTNKVGNLRQDSNGYYECVVGGLNVFNSAGQLYVYEEAKSLFESSSQLMRRVQRGALRGEYGHPKMQNGQRFDEYVQRVLAIYEENVCCHHAELFLDFDRIKDENGRPIIAIISKVAPSGPMGHVLERSLKNRLENVCFSIRSFTDDYMESGVVKRVLKNVVTFDYVNEPGISFAEKYRSPALEEFQSMTFSRGQIERGLGQLKHAHLGNESALLSGQELFQSMGWTIDQQTLGQFAKAPIWAGWK